MLTERAAGVWTDEQRRPLREERAQGLSSAGREDAGSRPANAERSEAMLIEKRLWAGIQDGSITVMFRRWKRRQVTAGNTYRTAAGRIVVDEVTKITPSRIRRADALAAGYRTVVEAVADLRGTLGDPVFLLRLHPAVDEDPRAALAN